MYYQNDSLFYKNLAHAEYIFLKLIGLSPWSLNIPTSDKNRRNLKLDVYKFSYVGTFYNILLIIIAISVLGHFVLNHIVTKAASDSLISVEMLSGLVYFAFSTVPLLLITYTLRQKKMIEILNGLKNVDDRLFKCGTFKIDNSNAIHKIFILYILVSFSLAVAQSFFIEALLVPIQVSPSIVNTWIVIQYSMLLDTINKRFKGINSTLIKLGNIKNYQDPFILTKISFHRGSLLYDIVNLKIAYINLCKISQKISDFYGLIILMVITFTGAMTTVIFYFTISFYLSTHSVKAITMINLTSSIWINISIIMLTSYVTKTINESKETPNIVSDLMDQCAMDQKVEKELDYFLHELSFRKVKFNACGIISLDRTLLATISGTCATYLVILIQFRLTRM